MFLSVENSFHCSFLFRHVCADMMTLEAEEKEEIGAGSFNILTSYLVFLHIDQKKKLFETCYEFLKSPEAGQPGSFMVIEDFFRKGKKFNKKDQKLLRQEVFCEPNTLSTKEEYIDLLEESGFTDIKFDDMTESWSKFVHKRCEAYKENKKEHVEVHGEAVYKNQLQFFNAMDHLYRRGNDKKSVLGGVRITCRKKSA